MQVLIWVDPQDMKTWAIIWYATVISEQVHFDVAHTHIDFMFREQNWFLSHVVIDGGVLCYMWPVLDAKSD